LYGVTSTRHDDPCRDDARCERLDVIVRERVAARGAFPTADLLPHGTEAAADDRVER